MKPLFSLLLAFLMTEYSSSQDSVFIINAGVKVNEVIPAKTKYLYKEFSNGKVYFRDGNISEGRLNYSRLMDEMHFMSESGDTLALDNEPTIRIVVINKDSFYFDEGYFMLVKSNQVLKLWVKQGFRFGDKKKTAGYDMTSSTSSVTSYSSFNDGRAIGGK
jgi:hypothetical protein